MLTSKQTEQSRETAWTTQNLSALPPLSIKVFLNAREGREALCCFLGEEFGGCKKVFYHMSVSQLWQGGAMIWSKVYLTLYFQQALAYPHQFKMVEVNSKCSEQMEICEPSFKYILFYVLSKVTEMIINFSSQLNSTLFLSNLKKSLVISKACSALL